MRAAAFPTSDHAIPFGDQVGGTPKIQIGKRRAEIGYEGFDVFPTATRLVQRLVQQHVGCRDLVDDAEVACLSPEVGEPAAYDGLVLLLDGHGVFLYLSG